MPYYRIIRPLKTEKYNYARGNRDIVYENKYYDRLQLIRAFKIIEKDLENLFEYIEPDQSNFKVFSLKLYELFLRICTEYESNCKAILKANKYLKPENEWGIKSYNLIEVSSKLSSYSVKISGLDKTFVPFVDWKNDNSLSWYQDYNEVKHNRNTSFKKANLENVLNAVSGLIVILFSQFHVQMNNYKNDFNPVINDDEFDSYQLIDSLFTITVDYSVWKDDEKYEYKEDGNYEMQKFDFDVYKNS